MNKEEIRGLIIAIAEGNIGEKESGNNKTKFGQWYGMDGVAWCAIFVSYCYSQAGWALPKINTEEGFHYVPSLYKKAKKEGWLTNEPKEGDIVIFDWNEDGRFDHTGIFAGWKNKASGIFYCIEGNTRETNLGNQSEGDVVALKVRFVSGKKVFFVNVLDNVI